MTTQEIIARFQSVRQVPGGWSARCPAHEDRQASLSISSGDNGRTLLHCHAGCALDSVLAKTGLTKRDLFNSANGNGRAPIARREVAAYDYRDEQGALLYQVVRFAPKDFRQRRPAEGGGWTWKLGDTRRVLYRLPELVAADPGATVFVVEGEKDCDRLRALGQVATCNCGGAGKWRQEYNDRLAGRRVVILPDNDDAGRKHGQQVAAALHGTAASVKILELSGLVEKGDVSDWLDKGGTVDELQRMVDAAEEPTAPSAVEMKMPAKLIDAGPEADAFLGRACADGVSRLRFWRGSWLHWARSAYVEIQPAEARAELVKHLNTRFSGLTASATSNVLDVLKAKAMLSGHTEPPAWIGDKPGPWPADEVLAAKNGLVHIPSLVVGGDYIIPLTPRYFATAALNYDFRADAPKPESWLRFLADLWPDDPASVGTLQEWMGYTLTPDTRHQKILLTVGPKRSGKGTIARTIRALIGPANCCGPTLASLATNFGLQSLLGKSAAIVSDARLGGRTDSQIVVERLLSISGEDALTIDRKFQEAVTAKLPTRLMIFSNELPRLGDSSGALASRMIVLRLTESFYGREDHDLGVKLQAELPGILLWAIAGWQRLRESGRFAQPESGAELIGDLEDLNSPIGQFLREECIMGDDCRVSRTDLYDAYVEWCKLHGRKHVDDQVGFGRQLRAAVPTIRDSKPRVDGRQVRHYEGVGLRPGW